MRNKKILILVSMVLFILMSGFGCSSYDYSENADLSEYTSGKSVCYYLDDGSIVVRLDDLDYNPSYARYYPDENKIIKIADLSNVYSGGDFIKYNDRLYVYHGVSNMHGDVENALFVFDLEKNELATYAKENDTSLYGIDISMQDSNVVSLKNVVEGDFIHTFIDFYDTQTGQWREEHHHTYDNASGTGNGILIACADDEYLYYLADENITPEGYDRYFRQFDKEGNEVRSFPVPEEFAQLYENYSRYVKMQVFGDYVYFRHIGLQYGVVCKIEDDHLEIILQHEQLLLPFDFDMSREADPVFYVNWGVDDSGMCYVLDTDTGKIKQTKLDIADGAQLFHMYRNNDSFLVKIITDETGEYATYIVAENELDEVKFGGEGTVFYPHYLLEKNIGE